MKQSGKVFTNISFYLLMGVSCTAIAQEGRGFFSVDAGYKTGDFEESTRTHLYSITSSLGYTTPRYDISITVPYLFVSTDDDGASHMYDWDMETDFGDVVLRGGSTLIAESSNGFSLDASIALKLPTADEKKGFGTGETDLGGFTSVNQRFGNVKISLLGGYIDTGETPDNAYRDVILYGIGASTHVKHIDLYASFESRRALIPGDENPRELNAGFFWAWNRNFAIRGNTFTGMNDGGPDFGLALGLIFWR